MWQRRQVDIAGLTRDMTDMVKQERVGAVLGYVFNGAFEAQCSRGPDGQARSLFDAMNIPHFMLWIDHPQWACEKAAISPNVQSVLSSKNNHHFLKSEAAAAEIKRVLGWSNCYGLPVAEDPDMVQPAPRSQPQYDVVTIFGSPPQLDNALKPFLDHDGPDVDAIMAIVGETVRERLRELWRRDVPESLQPAFERFGDDWSQLRRRDVRTAAVRHLDALAESHSEATKWLLANPKTYFDAVEHMWLFGGWQRTFYLCYLARHFRTAVLGADWTSVGLGGGEWVDHRDQAAAYAQGKVVVNISQGSEEEGLALKPFQIAASGVAMAHIDRKGLTDCFDTRSEVAIFDTPAEAREVIGELLSDPNRRITMATAARQRLLREHTWEHRLEKMFALAELPMGSFHTRSAAFSS